MAQVLLTGANGFIGSHLLEALLSRNYEVIILKRSVSDLWRIKHLLHRVKYYDIDVDSLDQIFIDNDIDVIVHLATLYKKYDDGTEIDEMIAVNVSFPLQLLEAGIRNGLRTFINTGTFFEYDCKSLPVSEDAKIDPFNLYAKTKLAFESILCTYSKKICIKTIRLFSPYGEKDNNKLIPMIVKKALANERIELSEGFQKLDFIYVADIVSAYIKTIEYASNSKTGYRVYNIGSGTAVSIREVVSVVEQKLGVEIHKEWGEASKYDIPIVFSDISRAIDELNWRPEHTILEGVGKTIEYYKEKNLQ